MDLKEKNYIVVIQCDIVKERCSGFLCEKSFHDRSGGFSDYPKDKEYRMLTFTCGGCCGLATHRKLTNFLRLLRKREEIKKEEIVVHLSSCMTKDNYHGPPCPHLDYIKGLIARAELDFREDTRISNLSTERRNEGRYAS